MTKLRFLAAGALLALALTGCGREAPTEAPTAAATPSAPAAAPAVETPAPADAPEPVGAMAAPEPAVADGETVGADANTLLSPIATAVAQGASAPTASIPSRWQAGKHYNTLMPAQPTAVGAGKVEVLEMFWYGCGHCFHLDPFLEGWKKQGKPAFVEFSRIPVMWNDVTRAHARLYYTAEALGKLDEIHTAIFRQIHVGGPDGRPNPLVARDAAGTEQLHRAFLKAHGVSDADFDRTYRSFAVDTKLQRAEQLTRRYRVQGVPLMIVAGKYTADAGTAGGEQPLLALVNDLAAAERRR